MVTVLSPGQTSILKALARYKFLTTSQMITLRISQRKSNLSVMLKPLKESKRAFIGEMKFAFVPSKGRLENFYYLKPKGLKLLLESNIMEGQEVRIPKGRTVMFTQDYFHRKYTIDCHIACDLSAKQEGIQVLEFDRYFDKTGNNRTGKNLQARTKIKIGREYLIADATLLLQKGDVTRLFAFELYNDRNTKRIIAQLQKHLEGVRDSSLCRNYSIEKGHRVLAVFSYPEVMKAVMERIKNQDLSDFILFSGLKGATSYFFKKWSNALNKEVETI
ncbi:MAG: hypothetical protein ACRBG0_05000 [Lewinella sp.]|uniref:hypothetical protein n=1 Tax=Lewinella sp. TaxID=2004506 RepID=UPI003D6A68A6